MNDKLKVLTICIPTLLILGLIMIAITPGHSEGKYETISASAFGTGTQTGGLVRFTLVIYAFSTEQDRQTLIKAFQTGQNQGLADALQKMKAVGHVDTTGTPGFDVNFIRMIPTPTGRIIRFIANRRIRFGEARSDSQSMAFDLTAGQFELNDQNKKKSSGVLYPATQLIINKDGEPQLELRQNAWRLEAIQDSKGTAEN